MVLRNQGDLLLAFILTLVLLGLIISGSPSPIVQAVVALPVALIVPGYALTCGIFPGSNLSTLERFLLTIGFSLGVILLSGIVLNFTPWGLQTRSWLLILSMVNLVTIGFAMWRRRRISTEESTKKHISIPILQISFMGLAFLVVGFVLKLSFTPQPPMNIQGYTYLWITPETTAQPATFQIGIRSQEFAATNYSLLLTFNGQPELNWPDIRLTPGGEWQQSVRLPAGQGLVEAKLYREDNPKVVYRHVSIMLSK